MKTNWHKIKEQRTITLAMLAAFILIFIIFGKYIQKEYEIQIKHIEAATDESFASFFWLPLQISLVLIGLSCIIYYDQKQKIIKIELNERCYRTLAQHTGKVVLEWDYNEKMMRFPNYEETTGQKQVFSGIKTAEEAMKIPRSKLRGIFVGKEIYYTGEVYIPCNTC
jgi:hypothetical protein